MTLAAKLQEKRIENGLTQKKTAELLGISRRQYIYYEKGNIPPVWQMKKLNELFAYDFSTLVYNQDELNEANKTIEKLKKEIIKLKRQLHDRRASKR